MLQRPLRAASLAVFLASTACGRADDTAAGDSTAATGETAATSASAPATAGVTVSMRDAAGRDLGPLTLTETAQGIAVAGTLRGLPPGERAIHLHTVGRCDPPFESAGDHWNPTSRQHGAQNPQGPHLGDLSNITVAADSTAAVQVTTPGGTLRGANAAVDGDGAAVVVHAAADDYRSDPAGNAGARIACGVVGGS